MILYIFNDVYIYIYFFLHDMHIYIHMYYAGREITVLLAVRR